MASQEKLLSKEEVDNLLNSVDQTREGCLKIVFTAGLSKGCHEFLFGPQFAKPCAVLTINDLISPTPQSPYFDLTSITQVEISYFRITNSSKSHKERS